MIFFAIANEFIMSWLCMPFKNDITWGDVAYHGVIKLGYLSLIPSIILYFKEKNETAKTLYLGLILWNIKEILDRIYYVAENKLEIINQNLFFSISYNDIGFMFQVLNIILVLIFVTIAYFKCTFFYRFLARLYWPFWYLLGYIKKK